MIPQSFYILRDVLQGVILLFFGVLLAQWLLSFVISTILERTDCPIKRFSFGFLGPSIRNVIVSTASLRVKIGKISIKFGKKGIITFSNVEVVLMNNSPHKTDNSKNMTPLADELFESDQLSFVLNKRLLWILDCIFPLYCYVQNLLISSPDGSIIKMDLGSVAITKLSAEKVRAEIFLHAITNITDGDSIHHIGYQLKCQVSRKQDLKTGKVRISFREWSSFLRVSGLHLHLSNLTRKQQNTESNAPKKSSNYDELIGHLEDKMHRLFVKYKAPLIALKILDFKVENLILSFNHFVHVKMSSAQIRLECVNIFSYGVNLEFFPSNKLMLKDHEITFSANSVVVDVNEISAIRIPLINHIITTDVISFLLEGIPIAKAKISHIVNIINPSIVASIDQVISGLHLLKKYRKVVYSSRSDEDEAGIDKVSNFLLSGLQLLPSFIFQIIMSNFSATLKLTDEENLTFKVYNLHSFLYHKNKTANWPSVSAYSEVSVRPELSFIERDPFSEQLSNYLKVVGTSLVFLKLPNSHDGSMTTVPIFGFERCDTSLDDISAPKLNVHSTLRHCTLTFDNLAVLRLLHSALDSILSAFLENEVAHATSNVLPRTVEKETVYKGVEWTLNLRMKDLSCSMLVAGYLPESLDPFAATGVNLTNVGRGMILVLHESFITANRCERSLKVSTADMIRIMDFESGQTVTETLVTLQNLQMKSTINGEVHLQLPSVRFKIDVNLIWLLFFSKSVYRKYSSFEHERATKDVCHSQRTTPKLNVTIQKLILEIKLPQDTPILLSFSDIRYTDNERLLQAASISAFVQSIYVKQVPVQVSLIKIKRFEVDLQEALETKNIKVNASSIRLHTEYHFRFYMVVDNLITMFKSFKQIKLAFSDLREFQRLYPSEQHPKLPPNINLSVDKLLVNVEEDPFEQELGLILKIGVLEQRERLQKLQEFEEQKLQLRGSNDNPTSPFHISRRSASPNASQIGPVSEYKAKQELLENFSTSWIARYRKAKLTFQGMPYHIFKRDELGKDFYFYSAQETSSVAKLVINKLNLKIGAPSFPSSNVPSFIHKYGKGVPIERTYTLIILLGIDIKTSLWELRLRDYPLPAISFPDTHTTGDVVFAEKMPDKCSLRSIYVPFVPSASTERYSGMNSIYGSHIIRTLNSVKTYFRINTSVSSSIPASITWGKSLQPGYSSLMLWFDYLTRPQDDPSPKLGFWDKFRYLVHGAWTYEISKTSEFHLNIKGSDNPYKIADDGAGLSFCWLGGTVIRIHGTEDPKEFLKIESEKFQLAVRDFTASNKFDKILMKLEGHVIWKLGLLFEQGDLHKAGEEERSAPSRPHYDIELVHPSFVSGIENYDSYRGFRSDFIHMSIGVYSSGKKSTNSLHLAPYTVHHFLKWWNLFHTYTSGPIRQGPLFTDLVQNASKFGRSLFTIKYQLHLEPLTFTHVYRNYTDFGDSANVSFTGLKGKLHSLRIDLHQKRVKLTHTDEKLKRSKPVWKFKMSSGEIDCAEADIRILTTTFIQSHVEEMVVSRFGIHHSNNVIPISSAGMKQMKESEWYDFEDYVDLDQVSLKSSVLLKLEALPLLYSPRISYFRKINDAGYSVPYPFGDEASHNCMIGKNHPERTQERLAKHRAVEIEKDIKELTETLEKSKLADKSFRDEEAVNRVAEFDNLLHKLKHRLHIVHLILNDLKLSERVPSIYSFDDCESSISNSDLGLTEADIYDTDSALLRTNTIQSFRSMRQASTLKDESSYDNRFIVHNSQLKINKTLRHHLFEYASNAFERKSMNFFLTYKSVTILKDLLSSTFSEVQTQVGDHESLKGDSISVAEFTERFETLIREVPSDDFDFFDSCLFRLISPQLQFVSDVEPDTAVILAARDIEVGIIDILQIISKSGKRVPMDVDTVVESRYCAVSKDVQLFALYKDNILSSRGNGFHRNGYGMEEGSELWPPWLPMEMCYDGSLLEDDVFLRRRSMFLTYTAPNPLFFSDMDTAGFSHDAKFRIGFPGLILTSTSKQYCSFYNITRDLLTFGTSLDEKVEKLAKVLLADEVRNNLERLDVSVVTRLQRKVKEQYYTREFLKVHDNLLFRKTEQELTFEIQATMLELSILMNAIKKNYDRIVSGSRSTQKRLNWQVGTGELIWELYDDVRNPFITIGLGPSSFIRSQTFDGSNSNVVTISSLQCFNQQESPVYLELLSPDEKHVQYSTEAPMIELFWKLGPPVGGIPELTEMIVSLQPILFKMDHLTSDKIMSYLFPKTEDQKFANQVSTIPARQPSIGIALSSADMSRRSSESSIGSAKSSSDLDTIFDTKSTLSVLSSTARKKRTPKLTTTILSQPDQNINEMVKRSSTYFNLRNVLIKKTTMSVCYKGAHHVLTDVNNLVVKVPNLEYHQKLWSRDEFLAALKKDITKVVVQHLGQIIGNKLVPHKKENRLKASMDISHLLKSDSNGLQSTTSSIHRKKSQYSFMSSNFSVNSPSEDADEDVQPFFPETGRT